MRSITCNRVRQFRSAVARPYRELPRWLAVFITLIAATDLAAITAAGLGLAIRPGELLIFALLVACAGVTIEMTRRLGESALVFKDICGVWELPAAVLLPPALALLAPLPRVALTQLRVRRIDPYRRVFSAAASSLACGCASVVFHFIAGSGGIALSGSAVKSAGWVLAVAGCGAVQWAVCNSMIMTAVKGSDNSASIRQILLGRQSIQDDLTEMSVATVVAAGVALSPVTLIFALPFVSLLQRSMRHAQLVDASRTDAKTGLLNAVTWRRESSGELARAQRTGADLAIALIDIDHFKSVNDTHGHLAGDEVLHAVSQAIQRSVREYDLVGRFGGEEFALLMPQTEAAGSLAIAERIRAQVAGLRICSPAAAGDEPIGVTVSVGVTTLGQSSAGITELLAAADSCLYRAKNAGRNQVQCLLDSGLIMQSGQRAAVQETAPG